MKRITIFDVGSAPRSNNTQPPHKTQNFSLLRSDFCSCFEHFSLPTKSETQKQKATITTTKQEINRKQASKQTNNKKGKQIRMDYFRKIERENRRTVDQQIVVLQQRRQHHQQQQNHGQIGISMVSKRKMKTEKKSDSKEQEEIISLNRVKANLHLDSITPLAWLKNNGREE